MMFGWMTTWAVRCGIATYSSHLISNLSKKPIIFAANDEELVSGFEEGEIRCWDKNSSDFSVLIEKIRQNKIKKLVIQHHPGQIKFSDLNNFLLELENLEIEINITLHNTREKPILFRKNRIDRAIRGLEKCKNIIVHSNEDVFRLAKMGISDNVNMIPHGIYPFPNNLVPIDLPSGKKIATFGFLLPNKGFRELITAFSMLKEDGWDKLVMLCADRGDSSKELEKCTNLIKKLNLEEDVILNTEFLDDEVAISTLSKCELVVFPYQKTKESASGAARMAIAAGSAIAVTPLEIFSDLEGSIVLPGISASDIKRGIMSVSEQALNESKEKITLLRDKFQWSKISEKYEKLTY